MQCNEIVNKILLLTQGDTLKIKDIFIFNIRRTYNLVHIAHPLLTK